VTYPQGTIYTCDPCRLQWADRLASAVEGEIDSTGHLDRYMSPESVGLNYPPYQDFFARLKGRYGDRPLRILDVGCGNGQFIAAALHRGHDAYGVDIDLRTKSLMSDEVVKRVIFAGAEEALPAMDGSFDVVTFWDSFEHMDQPFDLLAPIAPHMAPGGTVFLRVNNTHDIVNLVTKATLALAPALGRKLLKVCFNLPQHAWGFSRPAMTALLARDGWTVSHCRITETPSTRLTGNPLARLAFESAYLVNRMIGGGKIGEYWVEPPAR
jgi:2-polyprenyl-3-methyl-5-hydroxy-6-metoxy-1,4-benzoquinol methylase